jgi:hypothetical protein
VSFTTILDLFSMRSRIAMEPKTYTCNLCFDLERLFINSIAIEKENCMFEYPYRAPRLDTGRPKQFMRGHIFFVHPVESD